MDGSSFFELPPFFGLELNRNILWGLPLEGRGVSGVAFSLVRWFGGFPWLGGCRLTRFSRNNIPEKRGLWVAQLGLLFCCLFKGDFENWFVSWFPFKPTQKEVPTKDNCLVDGVVVLGAATFF